MHGGCCAPSCCAFTHRVAFEEESRTRVLLKSGPRNRGRSACGTTHVARLECPRETGLHLRCAGKAGNPFQIKQGNRGRWACGTTPVAHLESPRADGLILRCAGKAGNTFQTTQGNRHSCRDQEARRGSDEAVPGPLVFPSREPGVSGNFWVSQEGCQGPFRTSGRNRGLPLRRRRGQGPHLAKRWEPRGFSRVASDSRVTTGISGFLLGWPWEAQSSPRVARESWGLRSGHCRAEETSPRPVSGT